MKMTIKKKKDRFFLISVVLLIILFLSIIAGVAFGSTYIDMNTVYEFIINKITGKEIFEPIWKKTVESIIWEIRVPRVLMSAVCGGGLALCGVLMQCITKNPVADSYILGISSGASAGAVFMIIIGGASVNILGVTGGAFLGAILCGIIVFTVGTQYGKNISTTRLILTGLAVSTIFSSITNMMVYSAKNSNQVRSAVFWSMGSLGRAKWEDLYISFIVLVIVLLISMALAKSLDILILGDNTAKMMGMDVSMVKSIIILSSTFLIAVLVSMTGAIGFIGLVVPHVCRGFCGSSHRKLLIVSLFTGAIFLIWCDIAARCFISPREIPIGIITSIIGGPFFLFIIGKNSYSFGGEN